MRGAVCDDVRQDGNPCHTADNARETLLMLLKFYDTGSLGVVSSSIHDNLRIIMGGR